VPVVAIPVSEIEDWETFHSIFQRELGFPTFYGRSMNAWIDCLISADDPDGGMVAPAVAATEGDVLTLELDDVGTFMAKCPEQYAALVECAASVNWSRTHNGQRPILALSFQTPPE
jgi:hypothetical protein